MHVLMMFWASIPQLKTLRDGLWTGFQTVGVVKCRKAKEIQPPMKKINEIFLSIQGEGCHTGVPSVFVRFSGCNLKCDFCDTNHQSGVEMDDDRIIDEIKKYDAPLIVLTGGEPSLFIDEEFIAVIKRETGKKIAIETNGTRPLPQGIDWVTVSPKEGPDINGDGTLRVSKADELKVIDRGQPLEKYFHLECVTPETVMCLQPCSVADPAENEVNLSSTIERVLKDPRWRLSLQTHKFIGIR